MRTQMRTQTKHWAHETRKVEMDDVGRVMDDERVMDGERDETRRDETRRDETRRDETKNKTRLCDNKYIPLTRRSSPSTPVPRLPAA
jgi:hypothetical protein